MGRKTKQKAVVAPKPQQRLMSNGQAYTLENWREIARLAFGDKSPAVEYIDKEIDHMGPTYEPELDEPAMNLLLATIDDHDIQVK